MKRTLFVVCLCGALALLAGSTANARTFVVEIDGQRVVLDFYVPGDQTWQETAPGEAGYWEGLEWRPDPDYGVRVWYPYLSDTFDMTLRQQQRWARKLRHAGIKDWRIATFWDVIPMKASMFGGIELGLPMPNLLPGLNSSAYFEPTACGPNPYPVPGDTACIYLGRTGNEDGLATGAIINSNFGFPGEANPRYADQVVAKMGMGGPNHYTLPRSEAQDHWVYSPDAAEGLGLAIYNEDLNGNPDDTTVGLMSPVDYVTGEQPIGAWIVADATPHIWPPNRKFHAILISDVDHPSGDLIPVEILRVMQDERPGTGSFARDAVVDSTVDAAVVWLRAERSLRGNGRVYHITFTDGDQEFTFKIGVPRGWGRWKCLKDGGPLFDSTGLQ